MWYTTLEKGRSKVSDKKLCVLFPGIGYHCGKPLLKLSGQLAEEKEYTFLPLAYSDFPEGAKGNEEKMREAIVHAIKQTEQQLADVFFSQYERVIFIGKSIGTAACLAFRERHGVRAECFLLTPLEQTFEYDVHGCTAFHGTADQWAATQNIERLCREKNVMLYEYAGANHSLMTGDEQRDEATLKDVVAKIGEHI